MLKRKRLPVMHGRLLGLFLKQLSPFVPADRAHKYERGHDDSNQCVTGFGHGYGTAVTSISNTSTELGGIGPTGRLP